VRASEAVSFESNTPAQRADEGFGSGAVETEHTSTESGIGEWNSSDDEKARLCNYMAIVLVIVKIL
jgi:hypothetical protein